VQSTTSRTAGRLALVRHARSSHVHAGWIDTNGFRAWREAYEAAGIHEGERVPAHLEQLVERADLVLSSDAPRAVASARLLAPGDEIIASPLLRELDLRGPHLGALRLPLAAWALAVGGRTLLLTLRRQYPSAAEADRVEQAATWLVELVVQHSLIVAVTHASFRRRLASRLVQKAGTASQAVAPCSTGALGSSVGVLTAHDQPLMTGEDFRRLALSLPEATEQSHMDHPDFRVRGKIFATLGYPDDTRAMVKLLHEQQDALTRARPDVFAPVPGGWGRRGATYVALHAADEAVVYDALLMAWRNIAPKGLLRLHSSLWNHRQEEV
jgi:broad specificity phosphatase PhoE